MLIRENSKLREELMSLSIHVKKIQERLDRETRTNQTIGKEISGLFKLFYPFGFKENGILSISSSGSTLENLQILRILIMERLHNGEVVEIQNEFLRNQIKSENQ